MSGILGNLKNIDYIKGEFILFLDKTAIELELELVYHTDKFSNLNQ